jgi:hypothetical protein
MRATNSVHLNLLDLITLIIPSEAWSYKAHHALKSHRMKTRAFLKPLRW